MISSPLPEDRVLMRNYSNEILRKTEPNVGNNENHNSQHNLLQEIAYLLFVALLLPGPELSRLFGLYLLLVFSFFKQRVENYKF
jgi:thiosulfate reductase cytochrome b subunit